MIRRGILDLVLPVVGVLGGSGVSQAGSAAASGRHVGPVVQVSAVPAKGAKQLVRMPFVPAGGVGADNTAPPTVSTIACPGDLQMVLVLPNPWFDPLTATAQQLETNGFPPRPDGSDADLWRDWLHYVTHPITYNLECPVLPITGIVRGRGPLTAP